MGCADAVPFTFREWPRVRLSCSLSVSLNLMSSRVASHRIVSSAAPLRCTLLNNALLSSQCTFHADATQRRTEQYSRAEHRLLYSEKRREQNENEEDIGKRRIGSERSGVDRLGSARRREPRRGGGNATTTSASALSVLLSEYTPQEIKSLQNSETSKSREILHREARGERREGSEKREREGSMCSAPRESQRRRAEPRRVDPIRAEPRRVAAAANKLPLTVTVPCPQATRSSRDESSPVQRSRFQMQRVSNQQSTRTGGRGGCCDLHSGPHGTARHGAGRNRGRNRGRGRGRLRLQIRCATLTQINV